MTFLIIFIVLGIFFYKLLTDGLISFYKKEPTPFNDFQYRKKESVMNKSEAALFLELKKQLPENFYIFPKMRIADLIDANNGKGFYLRRNKILPKHIDFLICNSYFKPIIAIELNGNSHTRLDRIERDKLIIQIFTSAELPLEIINVGDNFHNTALLLKQKYTITSLK